MPREGEAGQLASQPAGERQRAAAEEEEEEKEEEKSREKRRECAASPLR